MTEREKLIEAMAHAVGRDTALCCLTTIESHNGGCMVVPKQMNVLGPVSELNPHKFGGMYRALLAASPYAPENGDG